MVTLPPTSRPASRPSPLASVDDDLVDTRPMPRHTREDFLSIHRVCAAIDALAPWATPWQVATACAVTLAEALHAHAVVIHQHDVERRELRSIGVHGPNAGDVLGATTNVDDDHLATAVLANQKPLMLRFDGALPRFVPDRHRVLGTTCSLAVYPVLRARESAFIVEIIGVSDERRESMTDACKLVAQRLVAALDVAQNALGRDASSRARHHVRPPVSSSHGDPRSSRTPATFPKRTATLVCRVSDVAASARSR